MTNLVIDINGLLDFTSSDFTGNIRKALMNDYCDNCTLLQRKLEMQRNNYESLYSGLVMGVYSQNVQTTEDYQISVFIEKLKSQINEPLLKTIETING